MGARELLLLVVGGLWAVAALGPTGAGAASAPRALPRFLLRALRAGAVVARLGRNNKTKYRFKMRFIISKRSLNVAPSLQ